MPDFRCYCESLSPELSKVVLSPDESRHLVHVNRARQGDPVVAFNGRGLECQCFLIRYSNRNAELECQSFHEHAPPPYNLILAQAIPKGKGLESIVRKATEMGVQSVIPLVTERTEFKLKADRRKTKFEKWTQSAIEGAKQSGNPYLPLLHPPQSLDDFLDSPKKQNPTWKFVASLEPNRLSLRSAMKAASSPEKPSCMVLIGPEGDFSESEYRRIESKGFHPIALGPFVLKCETAAVCALNRIQYELEYVTKAGSD